MSRRGRTPHDELQAALDAERANVEHLRSLARRQRAELDEVRRRTAVRVVLALERRSQPLVRLLAALRERLARAVARTALACRSVAGRRHLAARRRALREALASLPATEAEGRATVVVVAHGEPRDVATVPAGIEVEQIVVRPGDGSSPTEAARAAAAAATTDLLCFLGPDCEPVAPGWLARLVHVVRGGAGAATALVAHPERQLRDATPHDLAVKELGTGVEVSAAVPWPRSCEAGSAVRVDRPPQEVVAASGTALLVAREAYEEVGGLGEIPDLDAAAFDLCCRLRAAGHAVLAVPSAVVVDHRPVRSLRQLTSPIPARGAAWRAVLERHGPALYRDATRVPSGQVRFAITVAAPSAKVAEGWGDWHLAQALGRELRNLGHRVTLQTADHADDLAGRCCDIHLVLRGLLPVRATRGQRQVLWIISHPEAVSVEECDEADLVLVASPRFAAELGPLTSSPVHVMHQATDHTRFRPVPSDSVHAHDVTVVAKTRDVPRAAVIDALEAGLRPAIYGSGWGQFVDRDLVVAEHVRNDELPTVYCSAGVVLNDHWDTMKSWGFVSNRLFDVLACGAPVVSDHVPEVAELFGDAVPTYRDADELRRIVEEILDDREAARRRAAKGRERVLAAHTFEHRAAELTEILATHRLMPRTAQ